MPFDLHITIQEASPAGQVVQRVAAMEHLTPEQAVTRILTDVANQQGKKSPAEEMLGAFSSPDDVALMDEVMEIVHARRLADAPRELGL